ncbi:MAG: hypothetical protein AAF615_06955 [Pseudomonadota bacterium]
MTELRVGLFATAFVLPLRDAARGVRSLAPLSAGGTVRDSLLLPDPISNIMDDVLARVRDARERSAFRKQPEQDSIDTAREALYGHIAPLSAVRAIALVFAYAVDRGLTARGGHSLLVSETVLALAAAETLRQTSDELTPAERAAALVAGLAKAPIASMMPGITVPLSADDRRRVDNALIAGAVWLLTDPPEVGDNEERIFDLAVALTEAAGTVTRDAMDAPQRLATSLGELADLI